MDAEYPTVDQILSWNPHNDSRPPVVAGILAAWPDSFFPPTHGNDLKDGLCCEQGGWVYQSPNGEFAVVRAQDGASARGSQTQPVGDAITIDINTPAYPGHSDWTLVCHFHTHPLSSESPISGNSEPSKADRIMAHKRGVPGIVLSRTGFWKYGPTERVDVGLGINTYVFHLDNPPPAPDGGFPTPQRVQGTPIPDRAANQWEPEAEKPKLTAKQLAMKMMEEDEGATEYSD